MVYQRLPEGNGGSSPGVCWFSVVAIGLSSKLFGPAEYSAGVLSHYRCDWLPTTRSGLSASGAPSIARLSAFAAERAVLRRSAISGIKATTKTEIARMMDPIRNASVVAVASAGLMGAVIAASVWVICAAGSFRA